MLSVILEIGGVLLYFHLAIGFLSEAYLQAKWNPLPHAAHRESIHLQKKVVYKSAGGLPTTTQNPDLGPCHLETS